ncbi:MAG: ABC transporter substrate-binding protein [Acidobacteriia bacterium]|nr:ABC transporter substrate-binding protein [Terriglobia bacterium]
MKRFLIVFFLVALTAGSVSCPSRPRQVVVGAVVNNTQYPALELAVKQINAAGGINGVPLVLVGEKGKTLSPYDAQSVLRLGKIFADTKDLVAVIGHSDSAATLSSAAFYNHQGIPQIVTIASNPAITNVGSWTYRLCLSDTAQAPALAEYAVKDWGKKRIVVFYVSDDYGRGIAQLFEKRVRELGGEIVSSIPHRNVLQADDKELIRSVLFQLKNHGPELFVLFQRAEAALYTIRQIHEVQIPAEILGGDALSTLASLKEPPPEIEGVRMSEFFYPRPEDKQTMKFIHDLQEFAHEDPDYGHAFAFDAVYLIRDAIQFGGYSREGVKSYLDRIIREHKLMKGVTGTYRLAADHDARRSLFIVAMHGGRQELVKAVEVN